MRLYLLFLEIEASYGLPLTGSNFTCYAFCHSNGNRELRPPENEENITPSIISRAKFFTVPNKKIDARKHSASVFGSAFPSAVDKFVICVTWI